MKVGIIGRGLMGSAAARHLAKAGADVTLIGPSEPADKRSHRGAFGSHYDEGRITRHNASNPFWVEVSKASIARYEEIEEEGGVAFFAEVGALMAGGDAWMARVDAAAAAHGVESHALDSGGLAETFPYFEFPGGYSGAYERRRAGHVSPRRLVAAQTAAATRHGATLVETEVRSVTEGGAVETSQGRISFDQILVTAGGWTDAILGRPAMLDVYARTVALFEIDAGEAARLKSMPSLVWEAPEDPYLLPPIMYPDGKTYVKLGGDPEDVRLDGPQAVGDWFRSGGNADVRDRLEEMIRALMPSLDIRSVTMDACVTSWTPDRMPEIRRLGERVAVCTGGNGAGAKCSDELGRRGAALVGEKIGVAV
ncbi:FAD-binding oxidoreductase [uncultured Litoreibacter sp.]|uniref:NAD(P)/FAD-dependent oxidoreductase n=1 Tax=uncultured Litoreibacter sp. TaxID=1392394 RepID=UPI00261360DF|nr:FAD-binding oxidoreductase [uncultured Litoreibacter sp.]